MLWLLAYLLVGAGWAYIVWHNTPGNPQTWAFVVALLVVTVVWPWFLVQFIRAYMKGKDEN